MVIVALLGKSGSGKSTIEKAIENIGYNRIISYTTRKIRDGEVNHREYHFINREQFENLEKSGIIIERAEYNGNLYGSPKPVGNDRNVIVVESDGLKKLKQIYGKQVFAVYIDVDDSEIENRLDARNNTTDRESRKISDNEKFKNIENVVDFIVDGNARPSKILTDIMSEMVKRKIV